MGCENSWPRTSATQKLVRFRFLLSSVPDMESVHANIIILSAIHRGKIAKQRLSTQRSKLIASRSGKTVKAADRHQAKRG